MADRVRGDGTTAAGDGGTIAADAEAEGLGKLAEWTTRNECWYRFYNRCRVKIYTRTGDSGETGLFDGTRVPKSDARVATYGDVDELNAWLGLARAAIVAEGGGEAPVALADILEHLQRDLFALGARLADPRHKIAERVTKAAIEPADIARLENWIDALERELPPLRRFILPGGSRAGATLHVARTVCRRAERAMVALGGVEPELLIYINRVSDLLFVMARAANHRQGTAEVEW
jgi:cob(I)alamin adenosyltransferase